MNDNQKKQMEKAKRESEEKTYNVNAAGEKVPLNQYSEFSNQINNC